jgi:hypothetical protein
VLKTIILMVDYVINNFIFSYDNIIVNHEIIIVSNLGFDVVLHYQ